jgi:hypothetical protein
MAETYTGEVRGGVIWLDEGGPPLPEGAKVRVEMIEGPEASPVQADAAAIAATRAMLLEWARKAEEIAPELPRDLAEHHDHYAHGKPRE